MRSSLLEGDFVALLVLVLVPLELRLLRLDGGGSVGVGILDGTSFT